jgi:four helix bundle protein
MGLCSNVFLAKIKTVTILRRDLLMKDLLAKSFDFSVRIVELANYLKEENKQFPLMDCLLECGTGIGICLRISDEFTKNLQENYGQAYRLSLETEYMLELLVKIGFVNEIQIKPILTDCRFLKDEIGKLLKKKI